MKALLNITFFILTASTIYGQVIVKGVVTDEVGNAIIGANVYIAGTYEGTNTGLDGAFSFTTNKTDKNMLIVSFIGYKEYREELSLDKRSVIARNVQLVEEINTLEAVVITAGSFDATGENTREILKSLDVATTAGATADIAGALNTLPGTQTVGEQGRLFVRGGDSRESLTYIDGMKALNVYAPSAPGSPTRTRFSAFMFKGMSFSTGGYSAEYGNALSSVLALNTKDESVVKRADLSLMTLGVEGVYSGAWDKGSGTGKVGYYNLTPYFAVISQQNDWVKAPESIEANASLRQQYGKTGLWKSYMHANHTAFQVNQAMPGEASPLNIHRVNDYQYFNNSFKNVLKGSWSYRAGLAYSRSVDRLSTSAGSVDEGDEEWHVKGVFYYNPDNRTEVKSGVEYVGHAFRQKYYAATGDSTFGFVQNNVAVFSEVERLFSENVALRTGVRAAYVQPDYPELQPRLSLAIKQGKNGQFSLAFGAFSQDIENRYFKLNEELGREKAWHYIVNYQVTRQGRTFRTEVYHKDYRKLFRYIPDMFGTPVSMDLSGRGHARGLDVFWRDSKTFESLDYWFSYSFLDTERDYLDYPLATTPSFASKHNISLVLKHFVTSIRTQIGSTISYASGRPYHDPNKDGFMNNLTPYYGDLSVNLSHLIRSNIIFHMSLTNITGRKNIFNYRYSPTPDDQGRYEGQPVVLPAPRFLFAGLFITFSKDNTMNQMPDL
ncbi:MAG: TonB-dependent receptor [Cyclobacteriaceae bacterium]|nr:TonB-dependent receptor [Cyclobacteriaceae bacterium]